MNTDELKEEAKRHLLDYITSITEPDRRAGAYKYKCPLCGSGDHGKHKSDGAFTFYPNTNTWYCFACDRGGDLIALMMTYEGMSDKTAIDEAVKRYGGGNYAPSTSTPRKKTKAEQPKPQPKDARAELQRVITQGVENFAGSRSADYMNARGFSAEILTAYQIGHDKTAGGVIIPYPGQNYYIIRYPDKEEQGKYKKPGGITEPLFIAGDISKADTVYFCEGQIDALSLIQAGAPCAVAIGGAGDSKIEDLQTSALCVVVVDRDDESKRDENGLTPGDKTARRIIKKLKEKGLEGLGVYPPDGYKDANDILKKDPAELAELVKRWKQQAIDHIEAKKEAERQEIANTSAGAFLGEWLEEMEANAARLVTCTGFNRLDKALDGGLYPGLYVIGAISSLGKTTLTLQIADNIAAQGQDVLFFSLEMSKSELIARSISRLTYEEAQRRDVIYAAKTTRAIMSRYDDILQQSRDAAIFYAALENYKAYAGNLYFIHGIGNVTFETIRERTEKHIKVTGRKPIVIIDYLQTLAPADPKATPTDKQNTDRNVTELKRLSRDNDIIVFCISSFNRDNYKDTAGMASFKESGAIEYGSDILIGLEAYGAGVTLKTESDIEEAKKKQPREIELKILKNRNGAAGNRVSFDYHTKYNCFVDVDQRPKPEKPDSGKGGKGKGGKNKTVNSDVFEWEDEIL